MIGISKSFYMCGAVDLVALLLFAMYQLRLSFISNKIKKESLVLKKKKRFGLFTIKDVNEEKANIVLSQKEKDKEKLKAKKIAKEVEIGMARAQTSLSEAKKVKDNQKNKADSAAAAIQAKTAASIKSMSATKK